MDLVRCTVCGVEFEREHWRLKDTPNPVCSHKCASSRAAQVRKQKKGADSPLWKGGRCTTRRYVLVKCDGHPKANSSGYVYEHIFKMEQHIGRPLGKGEVIHHLDGNPHNNDITNLGLCSSESEHQRLYHREKNSQALKGYWERRLANG